MSNEIKKWLWAALVRAARTLCQTALATIVLQGGSEIIQGYPALQDIHWAWVASVSALAAIMSLLTSIGGIPEVLEGAPLPTIAKGGKE